MSNQASAKPTQHPKLTQEQRRPLSILTFTSLFPNSIDPTHGVFIEQRMKHVAALGHKVTVVAPVPLAPPGSAFAKVPRFEQIDGIDIYHSRYPLVPKVSMPFHGTLMRVGARGLVHHLHHEKRFDLVDAHYVYPDGFAGVKLANLLGLPSVVSARGSDINLFTTFATIRPQIQWTLQNAAATIAVSDGLKQKMLELGIEESKIQVIGNGVDAGNFRPQDRAESRRKLGIPPAAQVLVCVAGLVETKGHAILLEAVASLQSNRPDLRLYCIGKGKLLQQLTEKASSLGLTGNGFAGNVTFTGSLPHDDLPYWFSAADLSCLISSREGCPNAVAESLACGCPVVGSDIPGISELVSNQWLGILTSREPSAVAAAIDQALATSWDRQKVAAAMQNRTWKNVAQEVEAVFYRALGSPKVKGVPF
jgi:glycosyltransferase involved in cell wall biosynthesis